jgi:hypothetical protein
MLDVEKMAAIALEGAHQMVPLPSTLKMIWIILLK